MGPDDAIIVDARPIEILSAIMGEAGKRMIIVSHLTCECAFSHPIAKAFHLSDIHYHSPLSDWASRFRDAMIKIIEDRTMFVIGIFNRLRIAWLSISYSTFRAFFDRSIIADANRVIMPIMVNS